jgi:hypothetical protein
MFSSGFAQSVSTFRRIPRLPRVDVFLDGALVAVVSFSGGSTDAGIAGSASATLSFLALVFAASTFLATFFLAGTLFTEDAALLTTSADFSSEAAAFFCATFFWAAFFWATFFGATVF